MGQVADIMSSPYRLFFTFSGRNFDQAFNAPPTPPPPPIMLAEDAGFVSTTAGGTGTQAMPGSELQSINTILSNHLEILIQEPESVVLSRIEYLSTRRRLQTIPLGGFAWRQVGMPGASIEVESAIRVTDPEARRRIGEFLPSAIGRVRTVTFPLPHPRVRFRSGPSTEMTSGLAVFGTVSLSTRFSAPLVQGSWIQGKVRIVVVT